MKTFLTFQNRLARIAISLLLPILTAALLAQAAPAQVARPVAAGSFTLMADGQNVATFKSASGLNNLSAEVEAAESSRQTVRRLPGKAQPGKITLSQGDARDAQYLYKWHQQVVQGNVAAARRNVILVVHAPDGQQVARYELKGAWPTKLTMGNLAAGGKVGSSSVVVETVELESESISRID